MSERSIIDIQSFVTDPEHVHKLSSFKNPQGLNYFLASLALLSTMIGGGISSMPYSYFQTGFTLGIIVNVLVCIQTSLSCYLYF